MKTADLVLATNSETNRAFNIGALAAVLGTLGGVVLLYHFSVLSFTEMVLWSMVGVPVVGFSTAIFLAGWLGYSAEAQNRSLRYAVELNYESDE